MEEEERLRKEKEEELRKENEEKERKEKEEKDRLEKEKEDKDNWDKGKIALDVETMKKVREWIDRQDKQQKEEEESREKIKALQSQIEEMNRPENRKQCQVTGVDMFTGLDALQIEGARGMDLAAKAQAAMIAVVATKRKCDDGEESEGESIQSRISQNSRGKACKFCSGLTALPAQKVKFEVEWAHHWLGKEF